jgi:CubicO group peptidase (beta-lactamase class C family)
MGKLDPEADINNYLTSWKFPYDSLSNNKKISVYNLLSHTAGLDIHGFPAMKKRIHYQRCNKYWMASGLQIPKLFVLYLNPVQNLNIQVEVQRSVN